MKIIFLLITFLLSFSSYANSIQTILNVRGSYGMVYWDFLEDKVTLETDENNQIVSLIIGNENRVPYTELKGKISSFHGGHPYSIFQGIFPKSKQKLMTITIKDNFNHYGGDITFAFLQGDGTYYKHTVKLARSSSGKYRLWNGKEVVKNLDVNVRSWFETKENIDYYIDVYELY